MAKKFEKIHFHSARDRVTQELYARVHFGELAAAMREGRKKINRMLYDEDPIKFKHLKERL